MGLHQKETPRTLVRMRWVAVATAAAALALPSLAAAKSIIVNTTVDQFDSDGSRCSLREAIWAANNDSATKSPGCDAGSGTDQVVVGAGTFNLTRSAPFPTPTAEDGNVYGDLDITAPLTILHTGIRPATISGRVNSERVFEIVSGNVTMDGLTITDGEAFTGPEDHGGGILNAGQLTLRRSTIEGNGATFGGALSTEGPSTATLTNVTLSSNGASEDGGGISVESGGTVSLLNATISGNIADSDHSGGGDGGGIFSGGTLNMRDTVLGGNHDNGGEAHDCTKLGGAINSLGQNLVGNTNGCDYDASGGDIVNRSAGVLPLMDNGGPTETIALKKSSPAIDRGGSCASTDQRGVKRSLGGRCDIGAWELVRCQGVVVNRIGTGGPDLMSGTGIADGFLGLGGSDTIRGLAGNDGLCGGNGGDRLEGGAGNDGLDGGSGRDTCLGGSGKNTKRSCELPKRKKHRAA